MFSHPWWKPRHLLDNIRIFIKRGLYGYSRWDSWDFGNYIIHIMSNGIVDFKKDSWSYPACFEDETEWNEILNEITNALTVLDLQDEDIMKAWNIGDECPRKEFEDRQKLIEYNKQIAKKFFDWYDTMWW